MTTSKTTAFQDMLEALKRIADSTAVLNHLPADAQHQICDAIDKAEQELSCEPHPDTVIPAHEDVVIATAWKAALTGACNIIIQRQNDQLDNDGPTLIIEEQRECIDQIKGLMDIDQEYLDQVKAMVKPEALTDGSFGSWDKSKRYDWLISHADVTDHGDNWVQLDIDPRDFNSTAEHARFIEQAISTAINEQNVNLTDR